MKVSRLFLALAAFALPVSLLACGGWFEEAPPLLSWYLDRLPAKSFGHIYLEMRRPEPTARPDFQRALEEIAEQVRTEDRATLRGRVDELLAAAREHYENAHWCNLLHDVRDLLASEASAAEAADYLRWRLEHASWFSVPPQTDRWADDPRKTPGVAGTSEALELEGLAASAPAALRAHWLFLRGALGFARGERFECEPWFARVASEFPGHPRTEAALFLVARCRLAQSRADVPYSPVADYAQRRKEQEKQNLTHRAEARQLFENFLVRYPKSEFSADVEGWLGALAVDANERTNALRHYIRQVEDRRHPEVAKSALFMCQRIVEDTQPEDEERFALLAEHPLIAIGTTYLVLNAAEAPGATDGAEEQTTNARSARAKRWRQRVLPRLASEVAARKERYEEDAWPSRYLAILAQAASAAGQQEDALQITSIAAQKLSASDDLLLARGVALQRAGKSSEAITTYALLLKSFPQSPLAQGVRLKLALALLDSKQAGGALLELKRLKEMKGKPESESESRTTDPYPSSDAALDFTASSITRDISGAESEQIAQLIDTIYNFAPLSEIALALETEGVEESWRIEIRAVLAQRHLQAENFAEAKKFMSAAQYQLVAGRLETLSKDAAARAAPATKAARMIALGDAWEAARGKLLLLPLESDAAKRALFGDQDEQAGFRRRENGRALGTKEIDEQLEGRDELQHAAPWWLRAAEAAPGTALAAGARWKALAAIPRLADRSDYAFERAVETDAATDSRQLYERLRKEAPDSLEAKRYAVYWSFPLRQRQAYEEFIIYPPDWARAIEAVGKMGYRYQDYDAFGIATDFTRGEEIWNKNRQPWKSIRDRVLALHRPEAVPDLVAEVDELRAAARAAYEARGEANYLAALDDLALFLQEPNMTPEVRQAYFELRLRSAGFFEEPEEWEKRQAARATSAARAEELLTSSVLQPVADYVDFIRAAQTAQKTISIPTADFDKQGEPVILTTKDYWALERAMREFLTKYPTSRKREAARLLLARAVHWLSTPLLTTLELRVEGTAPPNVGDEAGDYRTVVKTYWREKFDPARAAEPLDGYDREFPGGQYAADIRDYRASVARLKGDWSLAIDLTLDQVDDASHPDLQPEAAVRLANLFAELADQEHRADMLATIRSRPRAIERLRQYLTTTWTKRDHPLRYLGAYLSDQLSIAYDPPAGSR